MEIELGHSGLENFREWLIIHSTTKLAKAAFEKILASNEGKEKKTWDVRLTINGFELPFDKVIDDIEKNLDEHIENKARELLSEKFDGLEDMIQEATEEMRQNIENARYKANRIFNKLFLKLDPKQEST